MANEVSPNAKFSFNAVAVGNIRDFDFSSDANLIDTSDLDDTHRVFKPGQTIWTLTATTIGPPALVLQAIGAIIVTESNGSTTVNLNGTAKWILAKVDVNYPDNSAVETTYLFQPQDEAA